MSRFRQSLSFILLAIFVLADGSSGFGDPEESEWWQTTLVYQIWPRSYRDSDGDGEGDIQGILGRLDYMEDLGVETICLNPIFPSPLVDSGYDVSDYKDVNPLFGSIDDFDELLDEAHRRDIKLILDVVPNHSSDQHEWFNASVNRIDPYTDYYVWMDGTILEDGTRLPPNNWMSIWDDESNSAWTWNDERGQWYYHKFHESQPDLNFENADVIDETMDILEFWLERGVDGFRITGIPYLFEDPDFTDEPSITEEIYTFGLPKNIEFSYEIRKFVDDWAESNNSTSKLLVAGSYDSNANWNLYYGNENVSGILPFNYLFVINFDDDSKNATEIAKNIEDWLDIVPPDSSTSWALSNHDHSRIASRIGDDGVDGFVILCMLLPGQFFAYYGDEIGMRDEKNVTFEPETIGSDSSEDFAANEKSNKNWYRAPMRWDDSDSAGFTTNSETIVNGNDFNYDYTNVDEQTDDPRSRLNVHKNLARLRMDPVFKYGDWRLDAANDDNVLILRRTLTNRPIYVILINLADSEQRVDLTELYPDLNEYLKVVLTSGKDATNRSSVSRYNVGMLPTAGIVLKSDDDLDDLFVDIDEFLENGTEDTMESAETTATSEPAAANLDESQETTEIVQSTEKSILYDILTTTLDSEPNNENFEPTTTTTTTTIPISATTESTIPSSAPETHKKIFIIVPTIIFVISTIF